MKALAMKVHFMTTKWLAIAANRLLGLLAFHFPVRNLLPLPRFFHIQNMPAKHLSTRTPYHRFSVSLVSLLLSLKSLAPEALRHPFDLRVIEPIRWGSFVEKAEWER